MEVKIEKLNNLRIVYNNCRYFLGKILRKMIAYIL
jgi:hypothetical protein